MVSNPNEEHHLTRSIKIAWSCGALANVMIANVLNYLATQIYVIGLGVSPVFLGWAMGIPRIWEAMTDPVMGNISDNTRSRWGRRRPYILVGAILSGIVFVLLWIPPAKAGASFIGYYFLITTIVFYTVYTVFVIPWSAMGLELSTDYNERTRVFAYNTFIQAAGGLLLGTLWLMSIKLGSGDAVKGVRIVGLIFGAYVIITGIIPALFCKERIHVEQPKISFLQAITETFKNRIFLLLCGTIFFILIGLFMVNIFQRFLNIYYVFGSDTYEVAQMKAAKMDMLLNFVFQGMGLAGTPLVAIIGVRIGKKKTLIGGLAMVILAYGLTWFLLTPKYPYLQLIASAMMAPGMSCVWVFMQSMLADICDVDEYHTGLGRAGMYSAAYQWVIKVGLAVTMIISGYMLNLSGYDSTLKMQQTPGTILSMRLMYMLVPMVFLAIAILFVAVYPLTKARVEQIRLELDARKNKINV